MQELETSWQWIHMRHEALMTGLKGPLYRRFLGEPHAPIMPTEQDRSLIVFVSHPAASAP